MYLIIVYILYPPVPFDSCVGVLLGLARAKLRRQGVDEEELHYVVKVKGKPNGGIHARQVEEGGLDGRGGVKRPVHDRLWSGKPKRGRR